MDINDIQVYLYWWKCLYFSQLISNPKLTSYTILLYICICDTIILSQERRIQIDVFFVVWVVEIVRVCVCTHLCVFLCVCWHVRVCWPIILSFSFFFLGHMARWHFQDISVARCGLMSKLQPEVSAQWGASLSCSTDQPWRLTYL